MESRAGFFSTWFFPVPKIGDWPFNRTQLDPRPATPENVSQHLRSFFAATAVVQALKRCQNLDKNPVSNKGDDVTNIIFKKWNSEVLIAVVTWYNLLYLNVEHVDSGRTTLYYWSYCSCVTHSPNQLISPNSRQQSVAPYMSIIAGNVAQQDATAQPGLNPKGWDLKSGNINQS